jgi:hypothetical protein
MLMSKDTPEVGDVWENPKTHHRHIILSIGRDYKCFCDTGGISIKYSYDFDETLEYIGKSKANIDDLFKTENEE